MMFMLGYGPWLISLLAACAAWFVRRKVWSPLPGTSRVWTSIGMILVLGCTIVLAVVNVASFWVHSLGPDAGIVFGLVRFIAPLALCVVALLFLVPPVRAPGPRGVAELSPRTLLTFVPWGWLAASAGVAVGAITIAVLAGLASGPDEAGRYVMYTVQASVSTTASVAIYGWFYSIPSLTVMVIIAAIVIALLAVISRPPLALSRESDIATRRTCVRNVFAVTVGGVLLHLAAVFQSLYGTSSLRLGLDGGISGWVELGTSFAAVGPVFLVASYISLAAGYTLWWVTLLSAALTRQRRPATETVLT